MALSREPLSDAGFRLVEDEDERRQAVGKLRRRCRCFRRQDAGFHGAIVPIRQHLDRRMEKGRRLFDGLGLNEQRL